MGSHLRFRSTGPILQTKHIELIILCWKQSKLPQYLRDVVIITLYKNKGVKSDCSNYRGITPRKISLAEKAFYNAFVDLTKALTQ